MVMHHSGMNTLPPMEFWYTRCTVHTAKWRRSWSVSNRLCAHPRKSRSALFTRCMTRNNPHRNALLGGEHSAANATFVHPLCGAINLHGGGPRASPTGFVHILGSPVAPYTLGVRLGMTLMVIHHSAVNTLKSTEFSYTCCTDVYS